ncbi:MAG: CRISPR-associated protein Cas4 [Bacteroidia bacterium]|nr:CRISPR-associated protein Cas4 [Bacteroidia bacterium]
MQVSKVAGHEVESFVACARKYWYITRGVRLEPFSELVAEGKFISDATYKHHSPRWRQVQIGRLKIDAYDPERRLVYEIKRAPRLVKAHRAQLLFYLYALEKMGIEGVKGFLVYPRQKKRILVELDVEARREVEQILQAMAEVRRRRTPPPLKRKPICKRCAFYDLCFVAEPQIQTS